MKQPVPRLAFLWLEPQNRLEMMKNVYRLFRSVDLRLIKRAISDKFRELLLVNNCNGNFGGRNVNNLVVVGGGSFRSLVVQKSADQITGRGCESGGVLEHGHALLAVLDVLEGSHFSVLTGDNIACHSSVSGESVRDGAGSTVVGSKDGDVALCLCVGSNEVCFREGLSGGEIPVGCDGAEDVSEGFVILLSVESLAAVISDLRAVLNDELTVGNSLVRRRRR